MVRMRVGNLIVLGLNARVLARLGKGIPVLIDGSDVDIPYRVAIIAAETDGELLNELRDAGGLGDELPELEEMQAGVKRGGTGTTTEIAARKLSNYLANKGGEPQPPNACGGCGVAGEVIEHPKGRVPRPGEWCICTICGAASRFDDETRMQMVPDEEIAELPEPLRSEIQRMRASVFSSRMSTTRGPRGQA